jgi:zinc protease
MNRLALVVTFISIFSCTLAFAQYGRSLSTELEKSIPMDTAITFGKLENGMRYYIRANHKPEKRAELRLVVNVGSMLEDDDQQGLAHFTEHMAFNGTLHFKKHELVDYLESIGMRFGPDVNAYTSFDETVYMLQIPTDTQAIVEKSFDILEDWAHAVSFDDDEIDKERGVVIEEWRLGRGANARMNDKQFPILFKNSHYAERLPIGKKPILENFRHETLRRFYRQWYRPDLMAVIAVGDFDKSQIEQIIKKHFSGIEQPRKEEERTFFPVPDHDETLYAIATDSEATGSSVSIYYKHELEVQKTEQDYRQSIVEALYNSMLNERLNELTQKPDPPFLFASSSGGRLVRTKDYYGLEAGVKDNGILHGMEAILTEAARVKQFGFTQPELDRQKKDFLRYMESAYEERDKTESGGYASECVRNFLNEEPMPGIAFEFDMYKRYLPGISLDEVNALVNKRISEKNRVVLVNEPEKAGIIVPTTGELASVFDAIGKKKLQPYSEHVSSAALVSTPPTPGTVVARKEIHELSVKDWTLSNGVRVILKPTDFKNDEVIFTSFSAGGTSLVPDSAYVAAMTAASIIDEGGLGDYDQITLEKMLAGKLVNVSPYIGELEEGLSGSASPQDLETMFQMIYLCFTAPRMDSSAYLAYISRMKGYLENRSARPESALEDTLQVTMSQYHPRRKPWSTALFNEMDLQKSFTIYRNRFADASDFTFIFVGNFSPDSIQSLVQTYLGGLPSTNRKETWKDIGVRDPRGVIEKSVKKGIEPKSQVRILFTGPFEWSQENRYMLNAMTSALSIKLREVLREEKGGTYGVGVSGSFGRYPESTYTVSISFGCDPDRVEELTKAAFEQIDSVKKYGISDVYVQKVKETQRREREVNVKQNRFWLSNLSFYYDNNEDPLHILRYDALVEKLTVPDIQHAVQKYFDTKNYVKVTLFPKE